MKYSISTVVLMFGMSVVAEDAGSKAELDRFVGTWKGVSMTTDGKEMPKAEAEGVRLVVEGAKYTLKMGDQEIEGTHKLDPAKKPKEIEAVRSKGPEKGEKMLGIYELTDDTFKVCFAAPGKTERPKDFKSEAGSGNRLLVFKREKK